MHLKPRAPGMLSGGFDLKVMRSSPGAAGKLVTDGGALITRMFGSEMPVVIACSGHAVAAGALLLLGADERIGVSGAFRIGLIETLGEMGADIVVGEGQSIGVALSFGGPYVGLFPQWACELARERLSPRQLQIATVGAKMYDPEGAYEAGFLDAVVDADALAETALTAATRWASLPRGAYRGQVQMNRGDVLGRLADAIGVDRGRTFNVPID